MINATLIHSCDPIWANTIELLYPRLGTPEDETLFPLHFVQVVLPKIGGKLALIEENSEPAGIGFLFPRQVSAAAASMGRGAAPSISLFSLRFHQVQGKTVINREKIKQLIDRALGENARTVLYEVGIRNSYRATAQTIGTLDNLPLTLGQPSQDEAGVVRALHQQIWQSTQDALYPVDIHCREFGLATDLVARVGDEVAGFLMGFYKDGGSPLPVDWWARFKGHWRIESQVMGILPQFRGQQLGYLLKRAQGELAQRDSIDIVNWTVDPLQFPNAVLNFGKLGAVAFDFYADLYPFRNELNQVPASRFGLTWLVGTKRVRSRPLDYGQAKILDVGSARMPKVNDGYYQIISKPEAQQIAIEIPANWTAMQREDIDLASRWRGGLDTIFQAYIGIDRGQYTVTGVGKDGDRCYLVAERSDEALWDRLAD